MAARPFLVNVAPLRRHAGARRDEERRGPLPDLEVSGSRVPADADVVATVTLEGLRGGAILATGTVTAPWQGPCRRCLGPASGELRIAVRELFEPDADDEETYPLAGDQVDLAPMVRDAVLLELPLAPLCAEACQGLCPTCGADRNEGTCQCEPSAVDPRWAALDQLRE